MAQLNLFTDTTCPACHGQGHRVERGERALCMACHGRGDVQPADPHVSPAERPRLSRQCRAILERLRQGPASNAELAGLALKYTSRISDARRAGHSIRIFWRDRKTGLVWYWLNSTYDYQEQNY